MMETYHVTNTDASGAGSLPDAVSQGNRRVVFDLAGTFPPIVVQTTDLQIDGWSSPGGPIVLAGVAGRPSLWITESARIAVRGLTIKQIGTPTAQVDTQADCVRVVKSSEVHLAGLDLSHAGDECLDLNSSSRVIVSGCYIHDAHYGAIVFGPGTEEILFYRTLFERLQQRAPLIQMGKKIAVVNCTMKHQVFADLWVVAFDYERTLEPVCQVDVESCKFVQPENRAAQFIGGNQYTPSPGTMSIYMKGNLDAYRRWSHAQEEWVAAQIGIGKLTRRTSRAWQHGAKVVPAEDL